MSSKLKSVAENTEELLLPDKESFNQEFLVNKEYCTTNQPFQYFEYNTGNSAERNLLK